ncbi:MAG: hypothetical protein Q4C49_04570 [Bacillota bacterium]|nr:hypothetical protein [Bacillota bacterium]
MESSNLKKNFLWNSIGSGMNAFTSLFFMVIVTRINGVDWAGVFTFAFSTANLFAFIGMYYGRVYQITDSHGFSDQDFFVSKYITCFVMLAGMFVFLLTRQYDFSKYIIILTLCLAKCLEAYEESIYAILQKNERLYQVGISLTLRSLGSVLLFLIIDILTHNLIWASFGVFLIYCTQMLFYSYPRMKKVFEKKSWSLDHVKTILLDGFFPATITILSMYLANASKYAIDFFGNNEMQTIFGIIVMPATVFLLLVQFLIHPYLNKLNEEIRNRNKKNIYSFIKKFTIVSLGLGVLIIAGGAVLGIPVLEIVYGISLSSYHLEFVILLIGAVFLGLISIYSNMLIAMHANVKQSVLYLIASVFITALSCILLVRFGMLGLSLGYLIAMGLIAIKFVV